MKQNPYNLLSRSKEELVDMISKLIGKLSPKERTEFISKFISAQVALEEMGEDGETEFIKRVETFCEACLANKYFVDPYDVSNYDYRDYNSRHNYYEDEDDTALFEESEWADQFSVLFNLAIMHSRNEAYDVSNKAFDLLLECLIEASEDESILGTYNPIDYIEMDWDDLFSEKFISMEKVIADPVTLASEAVALWMAFGDACTDPLIRTFNEIACIENAILSKISETPDSWKDQHQLYTLLKSIYVAHNLTFNDLDLPKSLIVHNPNFLNDVAEGYILRGMWEEATLTIQNAMTLVTDQKIVFELKIKMVDSLEQLNKLTEAYDIAFEMYSLENRHSLYLRARGIAIKTCGLQAFIHQVTASLLNSYNYDFMMALLRMYSYEGDTQKLIETVLKAEEGMRHNYSKYASKSILYRAIGHEELPESDLKAYLDSIEVNKLEGVMDMINQPNDYKEKNNMISAAIGLLKGMVQFHINAALRTRYARAAYYAAVIKDLYIGMDQKNSFDQYYKRILIDNSRRPALKDEFKKKLE